MFPQESVTVEAGYRFEMFVYGICEKKYWVGKEFAMRLLDTKNYDGTRFFSKEEILLMPKREANLEFSGICIDVFSIHELF